MSVSYVVSYVIYNDDDGNSFTESRSFTGRSDVAAFLDNIYIGDKMLLPDGSVGRVISISYSESDTDAVLIF